MQQGNPFDQFDDPFPTVVSRRDPLELSRERRAQSQDARANANEDRASRREDRLIDQQNRTNQLEQQKLGNTRFDNVTVLRKEFTDRKEVQNFNTILPMVAGAMRIADDPKATGADDLNIIYAFGKVMDPGSVVREGELALASNTGSFAQSLEGAIQKIQSGERLPNEVRRNLVDSMRRRGVELARAYNQTRQEYQGLSKRYGINPEDVVGAHPAAPYQQAEANFVRKPIGNLDGTVGARPEIATGPTRREADPKASALIDRMIRQGASADKINAAIAPLGLDPVSDQSVTAAQAYLRKNPGYKGSLADATRVVPQTTWEQIAASPLGSATVGIFNGTSGGMLDEIGAAAGSLVSGRPYAEVLKEFDDKKQGLFDANPKSAFAGNVAGGIAGMLGAGALARGTGLAASLGSKAPIVGDLSYGAFTGAGENNENRLVGAGLGTAGALGGRFLGNQVANGVGALGRTETGLALGNRFRGFANRPALSPVAQPTGADAALGSAIDRVGIDNIVPQLQEAQALGLPMGLVDTDPVLRELGGATVRRSPSASKIAEDVLKPRNRGQYDRFIGAVERDLGPVANIPQQSADLMAQARTAASPLYDQAYAAPVVSTPELSAVLNTPFGRQSLGRARTIAANERRDPMAMGFSLDANDNVVLNPVRIDLFQRQAEAKSAFDAAQEAHRAALRNPGTDTNATRNVLMEARDRMQQADAALRSAPAEGTAATQRGFSTQTLDYVKRGMDDILESQRNPITGRLVLDEAGRAQNQVRSQLLSEVDRLNEPFRQARQAYAGPMQSRDALERGVDAYKLSPNDLAMQVSNQSPEHLAQMQVGYRGALVDHAGKVRDNQNPFEATLGSPTARARMETLYPGADGVANLVRQRGLEDSLQQTSNAILGNSRTARNQIADQSFLENPILQGAADIGANAVAGGLPVSTLMKMAAGNGIRDAARLGIGKRAAAKADALAPVLFDLNPASAMAAAQRIAAQQREWQALVEATRPKQLGMFGRGFGAALPNALLGQ